MTEDRKPILCLDFDGVLHSYESGWQGADRVPDIPVHGAMEFIGRAVVDFDVQIFSSRSNQDGGIGAMQSWLHTWLERDLGLVAADVIYMQLKFPTEKPPAMVTLDDRAIQFKGVFPLNQELLEFQPWNKRVPGMQPDNPVDVAYNQGYEKCMRDHGIVSSPA